MANPKYLYQYNDFFRLFINGVWHYIDEPIGWDKINISGDRDGDYHGLNYEFIDPKLKITFEDNYGGGKLLREVYRTNGSDGDVLFHYGYEKGGNQTVLFIATVNFNDYNDAADAGVEITLEKTVFSSLLRTRFETKIAMNDALTLDGVAIVPPTPIDYKLHSKILIKKGIGKESDPDVYSELTSGDNVTYIQPETTNITASQVEELFAMPIGITAASPMSELRYHFEAKEAGALRGKWNCTYRLRILNILNNPVGNWLLRPKIRIMRGAVLIREILDPSAEISGTGAPRDFTVTHIFSMEFVNDMMIGDVVYFYIQVEAISGFQRRRVDQYVGTIEVSQETVAPPSVAQGYKILDSLNHVVAAITNKTNVVQSSFFDVGGCGEKYLLSSGFQIRKFEAAEKPCKMSIKDLFTGAHPLWNIMIQYSLDADGNDVILMEPMGSFFGNYRIFTFAAIDMDYKSYNDGHSKEFTFNEAVVGFNKFPEEDENTLDEFNTTQTWLMLLRTYKAKYSKISTWIGSGFMIEDVRREQFEDAPSTSLGTDDDIFVVAYIDERIHRNISFNFFAASKTLKLSKRMNLLPGDRINVVKAGGAGANDATTFTVAMRSISYPEAYILTTTPANDSGLGTATIEIDMPEAEKNENFDIVENVFSPETVYNLRISPERILLNHSEILNSGMEKKLDSEEIKQTYAKSNGKLKTQFSQDAPCKMMDDNIVLQENLPLPLEQFNSRRQLFTPGLVSFKVKMRYDDLIHIKERITGQTGTDEDFGVVAWPDVNGDFWEGYLWSFVMNPDDETCDVKIRKKRKL